MQCGGSWPSEQVGPGPNKIYPPPVLIIKEKEGNYVLI
jgi:hypothetical protein